MSNKYGARKTWLTDPLTGAELCFDSAAEATRYRDLALRQRAGEIADLRRQVPYPCHVNGLLVCTYIADFVYTEGGRTIVADCKGVQTDVYRLKKKLMRAVHGIEIQEVAA